MNLYNINNEIDKLWEELQTVDEETGEIKENPEILNQIEALQISKQDLLKWNCLKYKDLQAFVKAVSEEIKELQHKKKVADTLINRIENYIKLNIEEGTKIKEPNFEISWRKSESIEVDDTLDLEELHNNFPQICEEEIKYKVSKTAAKAYLKQTGTLPEGMKLITKNNISIK